MDLSAGNLFASMTVSTVGLGFLMYGKKADRPPQMAAGVLLMVYPYFVEGAAWQYGLAAVVLGGMWLAIRAGW
ncbi:MAG: hypothetical protein K8S98_02800 [Planctomycetes bacterium]|nr:hypothetical protein [Planctomycetota bacterium]